MKRSAGIVNLSSMELLRARWVECRLVGYRRDYAAIVTPLTSAQVVNASPRADPNL
ncbi:MAG: hypothetical protein QOF70_1492 [Acetobacteraceae bacterium]|nr:hypothetical protein [Acetobacteraceae bacterium]